ncbi:efflux RND transporter periplasmic adaptor subunit [Comamonas composti]|uniref:efflux RND transporter periplasmic adaptor subunit n=1 Tax=Comamonas composti TaxID=408558 RepID=UPI0003FFEED0|nr:efflux RND transporter periplasmic adaptor subunit [Comamonas composti]
MRFLPYLLAGALALPVLSLAADATPLPLTPEQVRTLGIRLAPATAATRLETTSHARVVLRPDALSVVAAPYAGAVPRILVAVGQQVSPGQALAGFTSPQLLEARRALFEAESQSRLAQQSLARDKALFEDGIIAASRWQATQARAMEARAMARARRDELASSGLGLTRSEAQLQASRAGVVTEVMVQAGARVEASAPLLRIADVDALELDFLIGRDIPLPSLGDAVEVASHAATARIVGLAPIGDGSAGMRVRAALDQRGSLRVGQDVSATLVLKNGAPPAPGRLRVPASALTHWQGQAGVFAATDKGITFVPMAVEASDEAWAVLRGPVPADARIAVSGIAALKGMLTGE